MASILIADDDLIARDLLKSNLKDEGHTVFTAANGEEALKMLQAIQPELIIADVMMPQLDGYALCEVCKSDPKLQHIPIILCSSAYTQQHEQQLGYDFGAARYLLKPVVPEVLSECIRELLAAARLKNQEPSVEVSLDDEMQRLKMYNEVLFNKLESKMHELEHQVELHRQSEAALKAAQTQLVQNEKMATIGLLAAGIAHEINNPLSFISSNLISFKRYVEGFGELYGAVLDMLKVHHQPPDKARFEELIKKRKLGYVVRDAGELIEECIGGADRLKAIVLDMKNFSRQDQSEKTHADINDLLKTTLNIARHELKYVATVEQDLQELPYFIGYPQQLGQVFLNLLVNAAQAMGDQGTITIRSWSDGQHIFISIADSGSGMTEEVKAQIFEPFFTTKPPGQGTGLGLPISADIIRKHGGSIAVDSTPGQGTTFLITLPVTP